MEFWEAIDPAAASIGPAKLYGDAHGVAGRLESGARRPKQAMAPALDALLWSSSTSELFAAIEGGLATSESVHIHVELNPGGRRSVEVSTKPLRGRDQALQVHLDVGEPRVVPAHAALAPMLESVAGGYPSFTYVLDLKREKGELVDGGLASRLGLSANLFHYSDLTSRIHPDDLPRQPQYEATRSALSDDEIMVTNIRLRDLSGEWRVVNFRSRVLRRDQRGAPRIMLGNAIDITDRSPSPVGPSLRHAEENERARIGRELHDSTSQHLVAAELGLANVLHGDDLTDVVRARLLGVQTSLGSAQAEMRAFVYVLHPPDLEEFGLVEAIERFCAGFGRRSGLQIAVTIAPTLPSLSSEAEHALFRVCQEALMNVYRHAFARHASVELRAENGSIVLEIRDDGIGVEDVNRFEFAGIGIAGMKARMLSIHGDLRLVRLDPGLGVVARAPADI